jgi:2-keto-3-deoxy-L-rhamnonate aldolase RhmA
MESARLLRSKLQSAELTLGLMVTQHLWLELIEIARFAGFDYLIIDLEHINHGDVLVADACRLGRLANFPILVRPPCSDAEHVRLAMDLGPCGLLLPMVESVAQVEDIQKGCGCRRAASVAPVVTVTGGFPISTTRAGKSRSKSGSSP